MSIRQYTLTSAESRVDFLHDDVANIFSLSSVSGVDGSRYLFETTNIFSVTYKAEGSPTVINYSTNMVAEVNTGSELKALFNVDGVFDISIHAFTSSGGLCLSSNFSVSSVTDFEIVGTKFLFPIFKIKPNPTGVLSDGELDVYITPFDGGKAQMYPTIYQGSDYDPWNVGEYSISPGQTGAFQMSFYSDTTTNNSLYFQTMDLSGYSKNYSSEGLHPGKGDPTACTLFSLDQHITNRSGEVYSYTMPYRFFIKTFVGDWYDAALEYRKFSETAPWVSRGKLGLASSDSMSTKLKDISLILFQKPQTDANSIGFFDANLNRFYQDACITKDFLGVPMSKIAAVQLGWNTSAFDDGYPYFIPQSDFSGVNGEVALFKIGGGSVIPYVNPVALDDAYTNADPFYVYKAINFDGSLLPGINGLRYINIRNPEIHDLILGTNNVGGLFGPIADVGVGGMLFDVIVGGGSVLDYSLTLSDNGGVGNTGLDIGAVNTFLGRAREKFNAVTPGFIMMSEGLSENCISAIDIVQRPLFSNGVGSVTSYTVAASLNITKIGLWESIYGDYLFTMDRLIPLNPEIFFYGTRLPHTYPTLGSWSPHANCITSTIDHFSVFFSHYIHLGMVPNLGNAFVTPGLTTENELAYTAPYALTLDLCYPGQAHNKSMAFVKTVLAQAEYYKKYSTWGRRMRPLNPNSEIVDYKYKNIPIATSIWKAHDNTLGVIITNAGETPTNETIILSHSSYGLGAYNTIQEITNGGASVVGSILNGTAIFNTSMPGYSIKIFKLSYVTPPSPIVQNMHTATQTTVYNVPKGG